MDLFYLKDPTPPELVNTKKKQAAKNRNPILRLLFQLVAK